MTTLTDASRRALYEYVRRQDHPVGREEAAAATEMSRGLAAFHLDKLVEAGLLVARYQAPPDQPRGRGRAPKVYEPSGEDLDVTIPERRYELIADILAEALSAGPAPDGATANAVAYRRGLQRGTAMLAAGGGLLDLLTGLGFEPRSQPAAVLLDNCPFHALAARHTTLVCGLNQAFVSGLLDGLGLRHFDALLVPRPRACCVELRTRTAG